MAVLPACGNRHLALVGLLVICVTWPPALQAFCSQASSMRITTTSSCLGECLGDAFTLQSGVEGAPIDTVSAPV